MGVFWLQDIFKTMAAKTEGLRVNNGAKGVGLTAIHNLVF